MTIEIRITKRFEKILSFIYLHTQSGVGLVIVVYVNEMNFLVWSTTSSLG